MVPEALPFEQDIHELERLLEKIESSGAHGNDEYKQIRRELNALLKQKYANLTAWETVLVSRHPKRPQFLDYVDLCFDEFTELHGDRTYGDDRAIRCGFGRIGEHKIMLVGHHKGRTLRERQQCFYGCAHPEGYRKALRTMKLAAKYRVPIVCLIDTPGAYPGIGAEERGQSQLIATSILEMSRLGTPIVCVVIGEGGSGGALGIGVGDRVSMMQFAYYSVISPEGCAGILWKTATDETKPKAATALRLTSAELLKNGIVDDVISEPLGGAHRSPKDAATSLRGYVQRQLTELTVLDGQSLLDSRYAKFRKMGHFSQ